MEKKNHTIVVCVSIAAAITVCAVVFVSMICIYGSSEDSGKAQSVSELPSFGVVFSDFPAVGEIQYKLVWDKSVYTLHMMGRVQREGFYDYSYRKLAQANQYCFFSQNPAIKKDVVSHLEGRGKDIMFIQSPDDLSRFYRLQERDSATFTRHAQSDDVVMIAMWFSGGAVDIAYAENTGIFLGTLRWYARNNFNNRFISQIPETDFY